MKVVKLVALGQSVFFLLLFFTFPLHGLPRSITEDRRSGSSEILAPVIHEPGFTLTVFRNDGLYRPTSMAFGPEGRLFVSQLNGDIAILEDADSDSVAETLKLFASGFDVPLGLAFKDDDLYVSDRGRITVLKDTDNDDVADVYDEIVTDLPIDLHRNNDVTFGPDGRLYFGLGSTCNECVEADPRNATVMRYNADGSGEDIFAAGLRNTYDLAFHPDDGTLWGADNGTYGTDELNLIVEDGNYGWPDCWGFGEGRDCSGTIFPVITLDPHSSPDGITFYTGDQFPPAYLNNLFIAEWGAFDESGGRKVVRVVLTKQNDSYSATASDFITGLDRPLDVAVAPDGALMISEYRLGRIYRVAYTGTSGLVSLPLIMRNH